MIGAVTIAAPPFLVVPARVRAKQHSARFEGCAQLEQNAAAADLDLTEDEDARLSAASDAFEPVRGAAAAPKLLERRFRR